MKRRDVLKGAAVAAGASVVGLPAVARAVEPCCERDHDGDGNCDRHPHGRVHVRFELRLPGPYEKLTEQLQEGIEGLEAEWPDMEVALPVNIEPFDKEGAPWLSYSGETVLAQDPDHIFKRRSWVAVERMLHIRQHRYWHHEMASILEPGSRQSLDWHREQRERLDLVVVAWLGKVTPRPQDIPVADHAAQLRTPLHVNHRLKGFKRIKS